jgi:threonine/homoserine/homoserine lactone efflux protein
MCWGKASKAAPDPASPPVLELPRARSSTWCSWRSAWRWSSAGIFTAQGERRSSFAAWRDGVLVNSFNPKTIVFMFAFLPPFIRPENGMPLLQLFIFGMIFNIGGTAINCMVAAFAGRIGEKLSQSRRIARGFAIVSASLFLVLAARMAFERR